MKQRTTILVVLALAAWAIVGTAQTTKTDRQLLTEALASLTAIRDRMPADPVDPPPLTCAPTTQSVQTSAGATLRADGGTGTYAWNATGGTPASGSASTFSTAYGTAGTKTVALASGAQTATCQVLVTAVPPPPPAPVNGQLLFTSSWETALGCNRTALFDSGAWGDYGGSGACDGAVHDADVVSDVFKVGKQSLRITQKPPPAGFVGVWNGTDFREVRTFASRPDVTLVAWLRYDANYHWASADHKIFIFTASDGATPNVYINYRGGTDAKHARLCAYSMPLDVFFCAAPPVIGEGSAPTQVTVGIWYRLRVHVVAGNHGKVEMWLMPDGQAEMKLNLVYDAGARTANINDLNTGQIGGLKVDTTYNAGTSVTENMFQWYDGVSVYAGLAQ